MAETERSGALAPLQATAEGTAALLRELVAHLRQGRTQHGEEATAARVAVATLRAHAGRGNRWPTGFC
jgi:hypothetical protein